MLENRAQELWELITHYVDAGRLTDLRPILSTERSEDIAEALRHLEEETRRRIFSLLEEENAGAVLDCLDELDPAFRQELLEALDSRELTEIVETMPLDDAADVLGDLPEDQAQQVLDMMVEEEAEEVQELLRYPEDTAGGIMTPTLVSVSTSMAVSETIDYLRTMGEADEVFYVYVVDSQEHLFGTVSLRSLVTARPETKIRAITDPDPISVNVLADQEEIAGIFRRYDLLAVPVVDDAGKLLGRITIDDVIDVIEEETTEDVYKMAGTDDEELESRSSFRVALIRLPWLLSCLVGSFLSGAVIYTFQMTLDKAIALAMFMPFIPAITATGGNAGLQTSTVTVRGLATGHLDPSHVTGELLKEIRTALIIGIVCGGLAGVVARFWTGEPVVGLCIGTAMFLAISVAAGLGILIPLTFRKIGLDPAISSGPFITTSNDITGLLIYLSLATLLLRYV